MRTLSPRGLVAAGTAIGAATGLLGAVVAPAATAEEPVPDDRPNIVLVVVDDMRADDLARMPVVSDLLAAQGTTFSAAYATFPLCCPSRASILTGQYPHNTGVLDNRAPLGGYTRFDDTRTISTFLDAGGYATGYIGKYLNEYAAVDALHVPPGWDVWEAITNGIYDPTAANTYNVNGTLEVREGYQTDVLTDRAAEFLTTHSAGPMFLHLAYVAPHTSNVDGRWVPPVPAPRHEHSFDGLTAPGGPAFDEPDMSDKPAALQLPLMRANDVAFTSTLTEARAESLLAVDEGVGRLVDTLQASGELDNTYLVFTSDNGYFLGEHRRKSGKIEHYEPVSSVPLVVRGPQVPVGTTDAVVGLHDLVPTFLGLAGAEGGVGDFVVDGRDLLPLAQDPTLESERDLLIQARRRHSGGLGYSALRTEDDWKFVRYANGDKELYDLETDPDELENLAYREDYAAVRRNLQWRLDRVRACSGELCRSAAPGIDGM